MPIKITLDPGHGGNDPGALGSHSQEKYVTLAIVQQLSHYLLAAGFEVQLTRNNDTFISLSERAQLANTNGSDFFISVHANAGKGKGTEVYALAPGGKAEKLAGFVLKEIISALGLVDRGVKFANFAVLRLTKMPAILVETAFIDNPVEEAILLDPGKQEAFGKAIAQGVLKFLGITAAPPSPVSPTVYRVQVNSRQLGAFSTQQAAVTEAKLQLEINPPGNRITIVRSSDNVVVFDQTRAAPDTPATISPQPDPELVSKFLKSLVDLITDFVNKLQVNK